MADLGSNSKACTRCGVEKPLDDFHKHKDGKGGRQSSCKECRGRAGRQRSEPGYRAGIKQRRLEKEAADGRLLAAQHKSCSTCALEKALSEFFKCKNGRLGLSSQCTACRYKDARKWGKAAYAASPEKFRKIKRTEYAADPEKFRQQTKSRRAADPEKYRKKCRNAYAVDPEKYRKSKRDARAADPEKFRKEARDRHAANPGRLRAASAKRRAKKLNATPPWADLEAIEAFYAACPDGRHVDHDLPLQGKHISGLHVIANLQYLTAAENWSKGNSFNPDDWYWVKEK